jgi:hypothetical protein
LKGQDRNVGFSPINLPLMKKNRGQEGTEKAQTSSKNRPLMQKNREQVRSEDGETFPIHQSLFNQKTTTFGLVSQTFFLLAV